MPYVKQGQNQRPFSIWGFNFPSKMTLTPEQKKARAGKITASFASQLMAGNEKAILNKWRELVDDPNWEPEKEKDLWLLRAGSAMEKVMADWREHKTGRPQTRRGEVVSHPDVPWLASTLDAYDLHPDGKGPVEIKWFQRFRKVEDAVAYHTPQVITQCFCTGDKHGYLYYSDGGVEPKEIKISASGDYGEEVWRRLNFFNNCVRTLTPPVKLPSIAAPPPPSEWIDKDMSTSNLWGELSHEWLRLESSAKAFKVTVDGIKEIIPNNVGKAYGHGIIATRAKNGAITIKREGEKNE